MPVRSQILQPKLTDSNLRRRARRIDAHNAVVDAVRAAGMITLKDLAALPAVSGHYSDEHTAYKSMAGALRSRCYPALELVEIDTRRIHWRPKGEGAPVQLIVFWKPLLEAIRRAANRPVA